MKKTKIAAAVLAGVLAFTGVPNLAEPLTVSVSAASKLAAPAGIKATVTDTTVKLSWKKVSGADSYRVFKYNAKTKKFEKYKDVKTTSCTVTGLTAGSVNKFKIAALVKSSVQTQSAAQSVKTKLAAPKNVKASAGSSTVKLTWSKVQGADAYRVFKYNNSTKKFETYKNVAAASCTVSGLKAGTYQFCVAALVESGSKYTVQTKSAAVKATVKSSGSTSNTSSGAPIVFPNFGTSRSAAESKFNLSEITRIDGIKQGVNATAGYTKLNGKDCMVMLYFNGDTFFYGAAMIPTSAVSFSKALSALKSANGSDCISVSSEGLDFYEWVNQAAQTGEILAGSSGDSTFLYGKISVRYAPESMKGKGGSVEDSLKEISGIL